MTVPPEKTCVADVTRLISTLSGAIAPVPQQMPWAYPPLSSCLQCVVIAIRTAVKPREYSTIRQPSAVSLLMLEPPLFIL